jgi:hypothetical protein
MDHKEASLISRCYTDRLVTLYGRQEIPGALAQYCNPSSLVDVQSSIYNMIKMLSRHKSYLNIGTGPGLLEYTASKEGFNIESVEFLDMDDNTQEIYSILRELLEVNVTYKSTDFYTNYDILNCSKTYDTILLYRFGPFQIDCSPELIDKFFNVLSRYSDTLIIHHGPSSIYPNILNYIKQNYQVELLEYNKAKYNKIILQKNA